MSTSGNPTGENAVPEGLDQEDFDCNFGVCHFVVSGDEETFSGPSTRRASIPSGMYCFDPRDDSLVCYFLSRLADQVDLGRRQTTTKMSSLQSKTNLHR